MEGIIEKAATKKLVAENTAFHVWLDPRENKSVVIQDEFRRMVQRFKGSDCEILWPTYDV